MKVFDSGNTPWESKVNFVDKNNVLVGYDMSQHCCEHADWFISDDPQTARPDGELDQPKELEDWVFDPGYFEDIAHAVGVHDGGMVRFRLINESGGQKFLHLFNAHNGYYSHGFSMDIGDQSQYGGYI